MEYFLNVVQAGCGVRKNHQHRIAGDRSSELHAGRALNDCFGGFAVGGPYFFRTMARYTIKVHGFHSPAVKAVERAMYF